ncbi:MAG: hypothetical protein J4G05_08485 [Chlorobi bacterium]|nr:hypothetical protein [Chlorobiota bacterium]
MSSVEDFGRLGVQSYPTEVSAYARSLRSGLKVGVNVTLGGLTGPMKESRQLCSTRRAIFC